jgi:hypothetical protein
VSTAEALSFSDGQASGIEELAGGSPAVINMIHDASNTISTRPGLSTWSWFPSAVPDVSPVIGVWIFGAYVVYCTADRKLWAALAPGLIVPLSDSTSPTKLDGTGRPQAVATKTRIVIIGGGVPQKWEGSGLSARLGGNPPAGNGIVAIQQRLVISGNADIIYYSDVSELGGGHETWNTGDAGQIEAAASTDLIVGLGSTVNELYVLGQKTLQVFIPDTSIPSISPFIPGPTIEVGSVAGGSLVKVDALFAFMDDRRRIVTSNGRSFDDLSGVVLAKTLWRFGTVSDCWSFRARFDAVDLIGFVFPIEGRACIYNIGGKKWAEWRSIDSDGRWQPWVGQCHCYWQDQGIHLVGMPDGTIAVLDPTVFTEEGLTIKGLVRTGFDNRNTGNQKVCERLQFVMRRGSTTASTAPIVEIRWRDNLGAFGRPLRLSLGAAGDVETQVSKWTLGVYNNRQWELTMSDPSQFVLAGVEEMYTTLEA